MRGMEVATFGFLSKEQAERAPRAAITQVQPWPCQATFAVCRHGWPRLCTLLSEAPPVLSRDQPMILSWFWRSGIGEQYSWASNMTMTTPIREKSLREPGPAETDNPCSIARQLPLLPPGTLKLCKSWGEMTEHGGDCGSPGFRYKPWCAEILWKDCQILYSRSHSHGKLTMKTMGPTKSSSERVKSATPKAKKETKRILKGSEVNNVMVFYHYKQHPRLLWVYA